MKVCISVPGRFHGFDLARELEKKGLLYCLVTSYPKYKVKSYGINLQHVKTIVSKELILRLWHKLFRYFPDWFWVNEWYDRIASLIMPMDADIYVLWAGFALHSIRKIRKKNPTAKIILERGSAHIEEQNELLLSIGLKDPVNPKIINKEKQEYEKADFISVPSTFAAKSFLSRGIQKKKLKINPYGVNLSQFSPISEVKIKNEFVIGYVGFISKRKNCEGIINAVKILVDKGYNITLQIAGGIDKNYYSTDFLRKFSFIKYVGNLPQNKLPEFYQNMDVFVLNSIEDGFGLVILQAMSTGICTITTINTGGPDVITHGENGFIIPINNDLELSKVIEELYIDREECKQIGINARKSVLRGFSWSDYGNRFIEFAL